MSDEELFGLYWLEGESLRDIADDCCITQETVRRALVRSGIPVRTQGEGRTLSALRARTSYKGRLRRARYLEMLWDRYGIAGCRDRLRTEGAACRAQG